MYVQELINIAALPDRAEIIANISGSAAFEQISRNPLWVHWVHGLHKVMPISLLCVCYVCVCAGTFSSHQC
jgi:hypothetical protein